MTDQLTPEQIQQAREIATAWAHYEYSDDDASNDLAELARAVLALTEQLEPPQQESSLAQRIAAQCTCEYPYPREIWAGHHPNCATEQQPEPVSVDEFSDFLDGCGVQGSMSIALSADYRYTITRKQPEGSDHA